MQKNEIKNEINEIQNIVIEKSTCHFPSIIVSQKQIKTDISHSTSKTTFQTTQNRIEKTHNNKKLKLKFHNIKEKTGIFCTKIIN